jgi:Carboxypeptidase regulatory-like domain
MSILRTSVCLLAVLFCCVTAASAHNIYASMTGTVTDQSGAVVPGATITATNTDTGFKRSAVANERCDFLLVQLPIGNYTLTAEMTGFRTESRSGIVLQVDQRARADIKLQVGATTETVQVTASASLVQAETSAVGQVINNTQVIELPLNGRNFNQLPLIVVGAQPAPAVGTVGSGCSTGGARQHEQLSA